MKITHTGMIMNSLNQCKVCQDCPKFEICVSGPIPLYTICDWLIRFFHSLCSANVHWTLLITRHIVGNEDIPMNKADADEEFPVKIQQRNPRNKEFQQRTLHVHHFQDTQDPGVTWDRPTQLSSQSKSKTQPGKWKWNGRGDQLMHKA